MIDRLITYDIETEGLRFKKDKVLCFSYSRGDKSGVYHTRDEIQGFFDWANKNNMMLAGHNLKFDAKFLIEMGIKGVRIDHDSLMMASLFMFEDKGLKDLCIKLLKVEDWSVDRRKMAEMDQALMDQYAMKDAEMTWKLCQYLWTKVEEKGMADYYTTKTMPLYRLLMEVESHGVCVDMATLVAERTRVLGQLCESERVFKESFADVLKPVKRRLIDAELKKITAKREETRIRQAERIESTYEFNLNSSIQVAELLKEIRVSPKDKEGKFTTSSKALRYYAEAHPLIPALMQYRGIVKTSQFLTSWQEKAIDGRLYGNYNLHVVDTGRLSSSEPNLQQVPKDSTLRSIFKASDGKTWVIADYCTDVSTRILMQDLSYKPAGSLKVGDRLWGFDESAKGHSGRKLRSSVVEEFRVESRPTLGICTSEGRVFCTPEHRFLVSKPDQGSEWKQARHLVQGDRIKMFVPPYGDNESKDAGWLAGIADGEGWVIRGPLGKGLHGVGIAQKPGVVWDTLVRLLNEFGFEFSIQTHKSGVLRAVLLGEQAIRFLGEIRPNRLLLNVGALEGQRIGGKQTRAARVIYTWEAGQRDVAVMQTSTGTYISEGLLSHNCQVEPRMMAHFTEDPNLIKIFTEDTDIYGYLATKVLGCKCSVSEVKELFPKERQVAKALTLAIMYGMGAKALAYHLTVEQGIPTTKDTARKYVAGFYRHFEAVKSYQERLGFEAMNNGYITGINGRRLWLPKSEARHKAFNYINQNAASELCAFSQLDVQKELKDVAILKLLTHDEVCYECDTGREGTVISSLQRHMVDSYKDSLKVPLKIDVSVGTNWGAKA